MYSTFAGTRIPLNTVPIYVCLNVSCGCHGHNLSCSNMLGKVSMHRLGIGKNGYTHESRIGILYYTIYKVMKYNRVSIVFVRCVFVLLPN